MKNTISKFVAKTIKTVAVKSANTCSWIAHQPKTPAKLIKK